MIWINLVFALFILASSFCYFNTPRNENSWLISVVVSAFYGPCLTLVAFLLLASYFLMDNFLLAGAILIVPAIVLLVITRQKWKAFKEHNQPLEKPLRSRFFWAPFIQPAPSFLDQVKTRDGSTVSVDYFLNEKKEAPLIFFFFGGGFENNNQKQLPLFLNELRNLGFHVASIGYRQLPQFPWPKPLEDIQDCILQIMKSRSLGIQPQSYHLMGRSAGGFLAMQTSLLKFEKPIETCTAIYPVTDVVMWSEEEVSNAVLESKRRVNALVKGDWELAQNISLLKKSYPKSIRYFVVSGDADPVVDIRQTRALAETWNAQSINHQCLILRTDTHGFDFNMNSWSTRLFFESWNRFMPRRR